MESTASSIILALSTRKACSVYILPVSVPCSSRRNLGVTRCSVKYSRYFLPTIIGSELERDTNKFNIFLLNVSRQPQIQRGNVQFWYQHNLSCPSNETSHNSPSDENGTFGFLVYLLRALLSRPSGSNSLSTSRTV